MCASTRCGGGPGYFEVVMLLDWPTRLITETRRPAGQDVKPQTTLCNGSRYVGVRIRASAPKQVRQAADGFSLFQHVQPGQDFRYRCFGH